MRLLPPRPHLTRKALVIAGAVTLLACAGGGVAAYAAVLSPVSGSGVIHGCYTTTAVKGSHTLVLQDAGTSCPKGTTAISWNQPGRPGPAGRPGAPGRAGAAGRPGAGVTVVHSAPASACPGGGITVTDGRGHVGYVCNGG